MKDSEKDLENIQKRNKFKTYTVPFSLKEIHIQVNTSNHTKTNLNQEEIISKAFS